MALIKRLQLMFALALLVGQGHRTFFCKARYVWA
jgi:hypothetical protein